MRDDDTYDPELTNLRQKEVLGHVEQMNSTVQKEFAPADDISTAELAELLQFFVAKLNNGRLPPMTQSEFDLLPATVQRHFRDS